MDLKFINLKIKVQQLLQLKKKIQQCIPQISRITKNNINQIKFFCVFFRQWVENTVYTLFPSCKYLEQSADGIRKIYDDWIF